MRAVLAATGTASRITKYRRLPIHFFISVKLIGIPSWSDHGESRRRHTWSQPEFPFCLPGRLTTHTRPRPSAMLHSGLALLGGDPGNTILLNGVLQTANLEIGVPGFQPQVPTSTSEFRLRAARAVQYRKFQPNRSDTRTPMS